MQGFRQFLFRGNLIQLAVAVVIGASFSNLVTAFTTGLITPILGVFGSQPNFTAHSFTINHSRFQYGLFIDALFAFFITALILYYIVVVPSEWILDAFTKAQETITRPCPECTSIISKNAIRCPFCTTRLAAQLELESEPEDAHLTNAARTVNNC